MATISEIKQQAAAVKNATQVGENTAMRVGGALAGLADIAEQQDVELGKKFDKASIVQESGDAEDKVMSQKATTNAIADETTRAKAAEREINAKIGNNDISVVIARNVLNKEDEDYTIGKIIDQHGTWRSGSYSGFVTTGYIPCVSGECFRPANTHGNISVWVCFFDGNKSALSSYYINGSSVAYIETPSDNRIAYCRISIDISSLGDCLYNTKEVFESTVEYNKYCVKVSALDGYDNRIISLESQTELNKEDITELFNCKNTIFAKNVYDFNDADVVDHAYIKNDGTYVSESTVFTTGYIPCKAGDVFTLQDGFSTSTICAVYDSEKNFIRTYGEGSLNPYNTIPNDPNIAYVRFCPIRRYIYKAIYNHSGIISEYVGYGKYLAFIEDIIFSDQTTLKEHFLNKISNLFDKDSQNTIDRSLIKGNGTIESGYPGYLVTDYIPAKAGDKFRLANQDTNWSTWWCWYDDNKNYIGGYGNHSDGKYILVPEDNRIRFIRVTIKYDDFGTMSDIALYKTDKYINMVKAYGDEFVFNIDIVYPGEIDVKKDLKDLKLSVGAWKYSCDKIVCIGDSLTHGLYPIRPPYRYLEQGYPYYLSRMLNTSVSNQGRSGGYPSAVINEVLPNITLTDYNVFMLWLGTNGGLRITDSPISQFERPQPEFQYLSYKTLIETIQAGNTDCKIFIGTVFVTGNINEDYPQASVQETNTAIESLVTEYGLLKIDFSDLTYANYPKLHAGVSDTHFGKAGNIFVADRVCKFYEQYFSEDILRCEFGLQSIDKL